jgi:hypothetical protein
LPSAAAKLLANLEELPQFTQKRHVCALSKLVPQPSRIRPGRVALDPVGARGRLEPALHRIARPDRRITQAIGVSMP